MQLIKSSYTFALLINLIVFYISYKLGTYDSLSFSNPFIYWCLGLFFLTFTCSYLLELKKDNEAEIDSLKTKISTLLITKDSIPNAFTVAILPDIKHDKLQLNKLCNIKLISNTEIDQINPPSIMVESNKPLIFNMPFCEISPIQHGSKYIYYFKNLNATHDLESKRFLQYSFSFTPKTLGTYEISFKLETEQFSTVKQFKLNCC